MFLQEFLEERVIPQQRKDNPMGQKSRERIVGVQNFQASCGKFGEGGRGGVWSGSCAWNGEGMCGERESGALGWGKEERMAQVRNDKEQRREMKAGKSWECP